MVWADTVRDVYAHIGFCCSTTLMACRHLTTIHTHKRSHAQTNYCRAATGDQHSKAVAAEQCARWTSRMSTVSEALPLKSTISTSVISQPKTIPLSHREIVPFAVGASGCSAALARTASACCGWNGHER